MKIFRNKKGDVNWFLVITIVGVLSFAVVLYFLSQIDLKGIGNKEICRNSVLQKTTLSGGLGTLNCKTDYVCISGGGECTDIAPTITIKVNPDSKSEIYQKISNQLADCWWEFNEGQKQYVDIGGISGTGCAICSIIKFDKTISDAYPYLTYHELLDFMADNEMETSRGTPGQTYLNYVYGFSDLQTLLTQFPNAKEDYDTTPIFFGQTYMVATGQSKLGISNLVFRFVTRINPVVTNIAPYFVTIDDKTTKCDNYVTKAS